MVRNVTVEYAIIEAVGDWADKNRPEVLDSHLAEVEG